MAVNLLPQQFKYLLLGVPPSRGRKRPQGLRSAVGPYVVHGIGHIRVT